MNFSTASHAHCFMFIVCYVIKMDLKGICSGLDLSGAMQGKVAEVARP